MVAILQPIFDICKFFVSILTRIINVLKHKIIVLKYFVSNYFCCKFASNKNISHENRIQNRS